MRTISRWAMLSQFGTETGAMVVAAKIDETVP
jgi:hypothetical protein